MTHNFCGHIIDDNEIYFIAYAGGKRELVKKDQDNYNKAILLPWEAQRNELKRLGPMNNPNLIPINGKKLYDMLKEKKLVPFFDSFFEISHVLQVNDLIIYESIKAKNYDLARGGN